VVVGSNNRRTSLHFTSLHLSPPDLFGTTTKIRKYEKNEKNEKNEQNERSMNERTCSVCSICRGDGLCREKNLYCVVVHPCPDAVINAPAAAAAAPIDIPSHAAAAAIEPAVAVAAPDAVDVVHMVATLIDEMDMGIRSMDDIDIPIPHIGNGSPVGVNEWDTQFLCDA
jgi:hypothetical protein